MEHCLGEVVPAEHLETHANVLLVGKRSGVKLTAQEPIEI
jgi:hypothetical protein